MNPRMKKVFSAVLLVIFLISTGWLLRNIFSYGTGDNTYSDAAEIARSASVAETAGTLPLPAEHEEETAEPMLAWIPAPLAEEDPTAQQLEQTDLNALRQVNGDVLGWIHIPGTKIDYPILQGADNEYYLKRTWKGHRNHVGSIFLETQNSRDFTDWNTIIYGHNMSDGSMFGGLEKYRKQDYWEKHPYIYIVTEAGVLRYEIFSSYVANVDSKTYGLSFRQTQTREDFLTMALEQSQIDTGISPAITDQILTLSTCSGGETTRRVIHARLPMISVEMT